MSVKSRLSRSLKVVGSDADRSTTYDLLLVNYSNHGPMSYRFRNERLCRYRKFAIFSPRVFNALANADPLRFCNDSSAKKTKLIPLPDSGRSLTTSAGDVNKTKFLRPRQKQQDQDQDHIPELPK